MSRARHSSRRRLLAGAPLLLVVFLLSLIVVPAVAQSCKGVTYTCPNCNGTQVKDCQDCSGHLTADTSRKTCINRQIFQPVSDAKNPEDSYNFLWNDIVATFFWFFAAGIAISCGVGGGGIYVPLGMLLLQFAPKQASGLSQCSIFGASLGGFILNLRNRHPRKVRGGSGNAEVQEDGRRSVQPELTKIEEAAFEANGGTYYTRPLINLDMVLLLAPLDMAGALFGVMIQRLLPNWLYLLVSSLVLLLTSYKTYRKGFDVRGKEKVKRQQERAEEGEGEGATTKEDPMAETGHDASVDASDGDLSKNQQSSKSLKTQEIDLDNWVAKSDIEEDEEIVALREQYIREDARQFPQEKLVALATLWIVVVILTLVIGGKGVPSLVGITCQSPWYWVLLALQFVWLFGFCLFNARRLIKIQARNAAVQYPYLQDDIIWDTSAVRNFGVFTFIAGIVAGLIGIGGGMVLNPLMMLMGVNPSVSSATTATMIVLTSSSVAYIYVTAGLVPWSYAVWFFCICLAGALFGKYQIDKYIRRTGRVSLLIFTLATIILIATIGCLFQMLSGLASVNWCFDGFKAFCTVKVSSSQCPAHRFLEGYLEPFPEAEFWGSF